MNKSIHTDNTLRWGHFGGTQTGLLTGGARDRAELRNQDGEETGLNQITDDLLCQAKHLDLILKVTGWRANEEFEAQNNDMIRFLFYESHSIRMFIILLQTVTTKQKP